MHVSILQSVILLIAALLGPLAPPPADLADEITPYDLINAINTARVAYGLPALEVHPILMSTAQWTADYMAINQLHGHIGDVRGRVMAAGYGGGAAAWATENWASGPLTIDQLMSGPWADAAHLIPVVSPNYRHIGAGVAEYNGRVIYIIHAAYTSGSVVPTSPPSSGSPDQQVTTTPAISQIIVPVQTATPNPDGTIIHEVKSGQSLWAIAIAYHTHIIDVQTLNGMSPDNNTVYIGQQLKIPNTANLVAPTPELPAEQTAVAWIATETARPPVTVTPTSHRRPTRTPLPKFTATATGQPVTPTPTGQIVAASALPPDRIVVTGLVGAFGLGIVLVISGLFFKRRQETRPEDTPQPE